MNTTHNEATHDAILSSTRLGHGDFRATKSRLARFCTEALADCASSLVIREKFASARVPTWRSLTRDEAIERLCGWCHDQKIQEWSRAYEASRQAAIAEMPAALETLGAAL